MFDTMKQAEDLLEELIGGIEPGELTGADAVELLQRFDRVARLAAVGTALCAARIQATGAWRRSGQRDAAGFVAAKTGAARRDAKDALAVGQRMASAPGLDSAMRSASLSMAQGAEIAAVVDDHPDAEAELLAVARSGSLRDLRGHCAHVASRGKGAEERHRRAHTSRSCSSGVGRDSVWRLFASMTVSDGAIVNAALDYFQTQAFDDARRAGKREPFAAYRSDALVRIAQVALQGGCTGNCGSKDAPVQARRRRRGTPQGRSSSIRHAIIITVPHTAFWSGHTAPGETCEVVGVGPVPVSRVHELLATDPIIKAVVTKGRDVTAVATMTRTIKDDLRLAVMLRQHHRCAVPDCEASRHIELDHEHEYARGGETSYTNTRPLCTHHHHQRTRYGYELTGTPGHYQWVAPDGTVLAAELHATPA